MACKTSQKIKPNKAVDSTTTRRHAPCLVASLPARAAPSGSRESLLTFCQEMNTATKKPEVWTLTVMSLGILLVFYPMTIAPIGPLSNGGILGFTSLVVAATFAWVAFIRQRSKVLLRWLENLPIAVVVTWAAMRDGLAQCRSGWWLGF